MGLNHVLQETLGVHARRPPRTGRGVLASYQGLLRGQPVPVQLRKVGADPRHRRARRHGLDGRVVIAAFVLTAAPECCCAASPTSACCCSGYHGGGDDLAVARADPHQPGGLRPAQGAMSDKILASVEHLDDALLAASRRSTTSTFRRRAFDTALIERPKFGAVARPPFNCLTGLQRHWRQHPAQHSGAITTSSRCSSSRAVPLDGLSSSFARNWAVASTTRCSAAPLVNRAGLARTFQNIRLFKDMSVVEPAGGAAHVRQPQPARRHLPTLPGYRRARERRRWTTFYWLEVADLVDCANRLAGEMS